MATIDADGHVIEPADLWQRELPTSLRERGFQIRWNPDTQQEEVHVDGRLLLPFGIVGVGLAGRPFEDVGKGIRYGELMPGGFDPQKRLRDMDGEGIDVAVLYPSVGLFLEAIEDAAVAEACCRVYNDWLADYCRTDPRRLIGIAGIPMQDVEAAVREMQRAVGQLGMRGVFVRPNPCNGRALHDPYFDRFWAAVAEAGVPVGLHPSGAGDLPGALQGLRLDAPIMGHPSIFFIDDLIGFSHLVCGGVLERHPTLTVAVLEAGGGWVAHWFDRFDHFAHVYAWMAPELRSKPSEYFKRQCYVSFDPDETTLPLLLPVIGEDRVVWASDYRISTRLTPAWCESWRTSWSRCRRAPATRFEERTRPGSTGCPEERTMRNARLLHYSHCVSNLERSRRFYVEVLGFEVVAEFEFDDPATAKVMDLPGCRFTGVFMKRDGMRIELIAFSEPPPQRTSRPRQSNEVGHSHLSFYVLDLEATLRELRAQGVRLEDRTRAVLPSGIECCVVRDPDGFPIEIVQMPGLDLLPYEAPSASPGA